MTKVVRGGRFSFVIYFLGTHAVNSINRISPSCTYFLRKILHSKHVFIIKNDSGIFEIRPFNDSMTISADYFERQLLYWIGKPERKKLFIDIGANIGKYTVIAQKKFHYKKVMAIEANPITFSALQKNVVLNNLDATTILVQVALSDHDGSVLFESDEYNSGGAHVVSVQNKKRLKNKIIEITAKKASTVFDAHRIDGEDVDFIKIDVEGFEYAVLSGMRPILEKMHDGSYIMIEISGNKTEETKMILIACSFTLVSRNNADYLYIKG